MNSLESRIRGNMTLNPFTQVGGSKGGQGEGLENYSAETSCVSKKMQYF